MNLVFIGASKFGLRCLETCLELPEIQVKGIITAPKTFSISYRPSGVKNILHADFVGMANSLSIPVLTIKRVVNEPSLLEAIAEWKPDVFLAVGWYHMIPKQWRKFAPAYGMHASLLPDYSGGAPLVWAMINGETKTGITLFQMDDGVDSGPIAGQKEEKILPTDTIATLYSRIEEKGIELLYEVLPKLAKGVLNLSPQEESRRRLFPQRGPEDGLIDWNQDASAIDRFIRAQTRPYPGAFTILGGKPLYIWRSEPINMKSPIVQPGEIRHMIEDNSYIVGCRTGAILLHEISYEKETYEGTDLSRLLREEKQFGIS